MEDLACELAIAVSRATTPDQRVLLVDFSKGAIIAERGLHEFYFDFYGIRLDVEKAPGCFTYTHFLISSATNASYEESLAALFPCFWIYQEVGQHIHKNAAPGNPYQKWIDTYASDIFAESVEAVMDITNEAAMSLPESDRAQMLHHFITTSRDEWMFWDMGYRKEQWPV